MEGTKKLNRDRIIMMMFLTMIFVSMIFMLKSILKESFMELKKYFQQNTTIYMIFDIKNIKREVKTLQTCVEHNSKIKVAGRMKYIEAYGLFNKVIGNYVIRGDDTVIKLKNGYLTYVKDKNNSIDKKVSNNAKFKEILKQNNIPFLYIQAPSKINKYDNQLPKGIVNYANSDADILLSKLNEKDIANMDLRELMNSEIEDYYGAFFRTDHHWKPETGIWAAKQIAKRLNEEYHFNFDLNKFDINNYNVTVYKDYFLGSQGKKVGLGYTKPEDISIITPKWSTNFTLQIPGKSINKTGNFEILLDYSQINRRDYYNKEPYSTYLYGDNAKTKIINNDVKKGKKILLLKDSFSLVVVPFLIDGVSEIHMLDLRHFKESVINYIEEYQPDIVIMMLNDFTTGQEINLK